MAKGSSGFSNNKPVSVGEKIQIGNYTIKEGVVTTKSGKSQEILGYQELSKQEMQKMSEAIKKAGIYDPVISGRMILPRDVAKAAIDQRKLEKEAFAKNVPGLSELKSAIEYDNNQRMIFNRSIDRGDLIIQGTTKSNTASAVAKKYPRASAYLTAQSFFHSSNSVKSSLGKEAMNKIASGKSVSATIKEMKKKWRKYTESKVYD